MKESRKMSINFKNNSMVILLVTCLIVANVVSTLHESNGMTGYFGAGNSGSYNVGDANSGSNNYGNHNSVSCN